MSCIGEQGRSPDEQYAISKALSVRAVATVLQRIDEAAKRSTAHRPCARGVSRTSTSFDGRIVAEPIEALA